MRDNSEWDWYDERPRRQEVRRVYMIGSPPGGDIFRHRGDKFTFSNTEIQHLAVAYVVLVTCFAVALGGGGLLFGYFSIQGIMFMFPIALIAVALGFILHEVSHKFAAQHYGSWSEFRYDERGLMKALGIAVMVGFIWAAPGATWFSGHVTKRENGIISLAGPACNMAIASAFLPFVFLLPVGSLIWYYMTFIGLIIAFLGAFNMIPISPLDGSKILKWNIGIFIIIIIAAIALAVFFWLSLFTTLIFS